MQRLYGEAGSGVKICPGETDCERFQSAAGKGEKKRKNACSQCPLLPTKTQAWKKGHKSFKRLVEAAMRIRRERHTGYPRATSDMRDIEFHTLTIIEQCIEQEEIAIRVQGNQLLMILAGVKKEG